jgi:hypothetical protein
MYMGSIGREDEDSGSIFGVSNSSIDVGSPCIQTLMLRIECWTHSSPNPSLVKLLPTLLNVLGA